MVTGVLAPMCRTSLAAFSELKSPVSPGQSNRRHTFNSSPIVSGAAAPFITVNWLGANVVAAVDPLGSIGRKAMSVLVGIRATGLSTDGADTAGSDNTEKCPAKDGCTLFICGGGDGGFSHFFILLKS